MIELGKSLRIARVIRSEIFYSHFEFFSEHFDMAASVS